LLLGEAHDDIIKSNDCVYNPFKTLPEFIKEEMNLPRDKVGVFGSWEAMKYISESKPGSITTNSGYHHYEHAHMDAVLDAISKLQATITTPWTTRHDNFTQHLAMHFLKNFTPKFFYVAYGETDEWAHERRYDKVLDALHNFDNYLKELWDFLQSSDVYRGKTTILLTTDHGRGNTVKDWGDHEAWVEGAQNTWMAFISPDCPQRGEWKEHDTIYLKQMTSTMCKFLGLDCNKFNPKAAAPITKLFE